MFLIAFAAAAVLHTLIMMIVYGGFLLSATFLAPFLLLLGLEFITLILIPGLYRGLPKYLAGGILASGFISILAAATLFAVIYLRAASLSLVIATTIGLLLATLLLNLFIHTVIKHSQENAKL